MNISENQRRTLDLLAESAGWRWADVEAVSQDLFGEDVAGLNAGQALQLRQLMAAIATYQAEAGE